MIFLNEENLMQDKTATRKTSNFKNDPVSPVLSGSFIFSNDFVCTLSVFTTRRRLVDDPSPLFCSYGNKNFNSGECPQVSESVVMVAVRFAIRTLSELISDIQVFIGHSK